MDATCAIQDSIHVFSLVRKYVSRILGTYQNEESMKVVILAGGFGTRISEESHLKPKPMIEIGGKPILWHIMKEYAHYGFDEFIICCGYKQYVM